MWEDPEEENKGPNHSLLCQMKYSKPKYLVHNVTLSASESPRSSPAFGDSWELVSASVVLIKSMWNFTGFEQFHPTSCTYCQLFCKIGVSCINKRLFSFLYKHPYVASSFKFIKIIIRISHSYSVHCTRQHTPSKISPLKQSKPAYTDPSREREVQNVRSPPRHRKLSQLKRRS